MAADEAQFKDIMQQNEVLVRENRLFKEYLNRHTQGFGDIDPDAELPLEANKDEGKRNLRPLGVANGKGRNTVTVSTLTLPQKMNICQEELNFRIKHLQELEVASERYCNDQLAMIGETTIRIAELKKEAYEFRRDIVVGGQNSRTSKISAERVLRYYDEKLKSKEGLIEKIKLKNQSLKAQITKMETQLKQKEEQGDSLHSIDFHQLKIENSLFNTRIAEKNDELLSLKTTTGKTVQVLNCVKRNLGSLVQEQSRLKAQIQDRQDALQRLTEEVGRVEDLVRKSSTEHGRLKARDSNSTKLPQILDYVGVTAEVFELQSALENWQRKVEIAEMALKRARQIAKASTGTEAQPVV